MTSNSEIHTQVSELLPWFVNGTLDEQQRNLVQQHLDECAECRDDIGFIRQLGNAINRSSPAPIVPKPDVSGFLSGLEPKAESPPARKRPLALVAAASIVLLAGALAYMQYVAPTATGLASLFETATSVTTSPDTTFVLSIQFEDGTDAEAREKTFVELNGQDVTDTEEPHSFKFLVTLPVESLDGLEMFIDSIESRPEVKSASIVAMQIPILEQQ